MSRHYFKRVDQLKFNPPRQPKPPKPNYKGKNVLVTYIGGNSPILMSARKARLQMGRHRGAVMIQETGVAHRFTSEQARKAALKLWKTRYRFNKRIGRRIGVASKRRPKVMRAPVRAQWTLNADNPHRVWWHPDLQSWFEHTRRITERTALRRLGLLPTKRKDKVPTSVVLAIPQPRQKNCS